MPSYEAFVLPTELASDLGVSPESKLTRVDVDINYQGYFWLCRRTYQVLRSKWLTWFPTDEVPLSESEFVHICGVLLLKRIDFVRTEALAEEYTRTGIGKSILIPAPVFDRLYVYGAVRVGNDIYLPTRAGIVEVLSELCGGDKRITTRPADVTKNAYAEFISSLEPRMVVSRMMPAKPEGTLSMLFYIVQTDTFVRPYCITDAATGADAVFASIAIDTPVALHRNGRDMELADYLSFIFTSPYTAVEAPEVALTNFILKSFRRGKEDTV